MFFLVTEYCAFKAVCFKVLHHLLFDTDHIKMTVILYLENMTQLKKEWLCTKIYKIK